MGNVNLLQLALNANQVLLFQMVNAPMNAQMVLSQVMELVMHAQLFVVFALHKQNAPNVKTVSTFMMPFVSKTAQKAPSILKEFVKNVILDAVHAYQPLNALNVLLVYH